MEDFFGETTTVSSAGHKAGAAGHTKPRSPRLRHVAPLTAKVIDQIFGYSNIGMVRVGRTALRLQPLSSLSPSSSLQGGDAFRLVWGGLEYVLELECISKFIDVPLTWWEASPGPLRAGLLGDFLRDTAFGQSAGLEHLGSARRADDAGMLCSLDFCFVDESTKQTCRARVGFSTEAAATALVTAWRGLPAKADRRLPDFPLSVHVELLALKINVAELRRLRSGAFVPVGAPLEGRTVVVSVGWAKRYVAAAVIKNNTVILQGGLRPMEESKSGPVGVALSELSKMENLEVQFTVELATCSLSLAELSRLGPGSTLNLGLPHEPSLVRLCVNGKAIATGELVVLGQSLGVQVVEMSSH